MTGSGLFKLACAVFAVALVAAPIATEAAVTCGQVASSLAPCIPYARSAGGAVPPACCSGIKTLDGMARTTPDRQATCKCLKSASTSISGINYGLVASLPAKCGVNIPYKISPSTDCARVK
ncbi:non-specific lipid-transfer protein 1-like [Punica granatum]|uniref:Non-specific lipid-transfer protein n=3 Tax=Punica granatum TaxID=22663 RepID=A0A059STC4_PUNGR|nr:non-specific lipid-transfer protein 1-like [Punica granatum]AHB19227.1 non specific lipid transfer protein 1A [Punica granatum]PKI40946.1 hypothetical protein CRG98_038474 [Punica granatum]